MALPADLLRVAQSSLRDLGAARRALTPDATEKFARQYVPPLKTIPTGVGANADRDRLRAELKRLLDLGPVVLESLEDHASLPPDADLSLEAVIATLGRPALLIANGTFEEPPPDWTQLLSHRQSIERTIASVGRIETTGGGHVGTGFLVAPEVVMTNRHVAAAFYANPNGTWQLKLTPPQINWRAEHGGRTEATFGISGLIGCHAQHDLALLRLDLKKTRPADLILASQPLRLAATMPVQEQGRDVYVVGYPQSDNAGNTPPQLLRDIFKDVYGYKRLQPGRVMQPSVPAPSLQHDCSTLGGNSGSPVVDLESHLVLGLHFRGAYQQRNDAVRLWELTNDPLLKQAQVTFVDLPRSTGPAVGS